MVAQRDAALYDKLVRKRMVWIEPKLGEVKQWHPGRRCRLRGIEKVNIEALVKAAGQNLKQLVKHCARRQSPRLPPPMMAALRDHGSPLFGQWLCHRRLTHVLWGANTFCITLSG